MLSTQETNTFSLRRLILIDAYRKGAITELKLDGHGSLTGANGVGKTSLLRLIPLFYGESPNKLVQGGGVNQSFVQYYLPNTTSFIVFEYNRYGKVCMVVLYASASGESVYYRFIDQPFIRDRFVDDGNIVIGPDLSRHIKKRGESCSAQITALSEYRSIIQNTVSGNRDHQKLAANYSFVGPDGRLSHIEKIVTGMFSRVTNFQVIKRIVVSCIFDDKKSIRLETSTSVMNEWVQDYYAYVSVMEQSNRMQDFTEAYMRHEEFAKELRLVHTDFVRLQREQEKEINNKKDSVQEILKDMRILENQNNSSLRESSMQIGMAEGRANSIKATLEKLEKQYTDYESAGIFALAQLVESLPQLLEDLETKDKREKALLGQQEDVSNQYANLVNRLTESFFKFQQDRNALKDPIRARRQIDEEQARLAAKEAWQLIIAKFDKQEEEINTKLESLSEQLGVLKNRCEYPQASQQTIIARDRVRDENEAASKAAAEAKLAYDAAKTTHREAVGVISAIDKAITDIRKKEDIAKDRRERLLSLKNAAPGTLLHFLRENRDGWTMNIAKVIPDQLLLRTDLNPTLVSEDVRSLYGVGLDLDVLDIPMAADENTLRLKIEEVDLIIAQCLRDVKVEEEKLNNQTKIALTAKKMEENTQRIHVQAENKSHSCKAAMDAAERALTDDIRKAGIAAGKQLQELQQTIETHKHSLNMLKSSINEQRLRHENDLKNCLSAIDSKVQSDINKLDHEIAVRKAAIDQEIADLEDEKNKKLKSNGVDTSSLDTVRKEKEETQKRIDMARSNEVKVGEWKRWLEYDWGTREHNKKLLEDVESEILELRKKEVKAKENYVARRDELNKNLDQLNNAIADIEKMNKFITKRIERLQAWPADIASIMDKPTRNQDTLMADMDRLLHGIQKQLLQGQKICDDITRAFSQRGETTPGKFYHKKRQDMGAYHADESPFLWLAPMQEWFDVEHENTRRLLLSQCRNFASGIHEFHDLLNAFKRKVHIFSRDLQEKMAASTHFRFINNVAVRITTSFDDLEGGWDKIKQMDNEYSIWAGNDSNDLPDRAFAEAVERVRDWLNGYHNTLDVKLEDMLGMEIDIEEVGRPKKTVKDEKQLRDASSNGLSYLILCVVFVGLINKIRAGQPIQLVWALDELRDLDIDNVRVLLDMLADNQIHLISAFPDPEPEILSLLKNRYIIQDGRRLATFESESANV